MGAANQEGAQSTLGDPPDIDFSQSIEYDNWSRPVGLRNAGNSYVQTIPVGSTRILSLKEGIVPRVFLHPNHNAITFVYE